jgi:hypothetical protein
VLYGEPDVQLVRAATGRGGQNLASPPPDRSPRLGYLHHFRGQRAKLRTTPHHTLHLYDHAIRRGHVKTKPPTISPPVNRPGIGRQSVPMIWASVGYNMAVIDAPDFFGRVGQRAVVLALLNGLSSAINPLHRRRRLQAALTSADC